ncbi:alcohol dehydrogenase [Mycobacterium sp. E342]|uniref:zinc-binding dehydrogenase n=1 Tax=unclassified Mycobacterium TaxID=2642494 RepID=UPI0008005323|nr:MULTISPECIES: zinc-binding dehydrogenase [unclassified Mycobacterium]OBH14808.1 alcohol dehydrogenase [Mycobacterium sp. E3247]OBH38275.1 alcohol dehydrogenase [Mycobacterium sp. E342]
MRAAVLRHGAMTVVDDVPEPVPGPGQVLVEVKACGICGSDLQFAAHGPEMVAIAETIGGDAPFAKLAVDLSRDVYMGHEFCAQVLEYGPGTDGPKRGTIVTSMPALLSDSGIEPLVYSNTASCGFGERMLLAAPLLLPVPNGVAPTAAAVTEPVAVGVHSVSKAALRPGESALVLGCGGVGLAIIAVLRARGVESIVAADPSPLRRTIAISMGAHHAVDPAVTSPFDLVTPDVTFEAAGAPGVLDEAMCRAPSGSRILIAGVCMQADTLHMIYGASKELVMTFANGYSPEEFGEALRLIADGAIDVTPMVTAVVDLSEIGQSFVDLTDPGRQCKILVAP